MHFVLLLTGEALVPQSRFFCPQLMVVQLGRHRHRSLIHEACKALIVSQSLHAVCSRHPLAPNVLPEYSDAFEKHLRESIRNGVHFERYFGNIKA